MYVTMFAWPHQVKGDSKVTTTFVFVRGLRFDYQFSLFFTKGRPSFGQNVAKDLGDFDNLTKT